MGRARVCLTDWRACWAVRRGVLSYEPGRTDRDGQREGPDGEADEDGRAQQHQSPRLTRACRGYECKPYTDWAQRGSGHNAVGGHLAPGQGRRVWKAAERWQRNPNSGFGL